MTIKPPILLAVLLASTPAAAQPGQPPPPPPGAGAPMPPPPPPEAPPTVDQGVLDDANSGRTWLAPTALTAPKGTFSFQDWELFWVGAGYSPSDNLSLSASTMIPLTNEFPIIIFATGKLQLVRSGRLRIAAHAGFLFFHLNDNDIDGDQSFTAGTLGGAATYCLDQGCHSLINGFVTGGIALEYAADQTSVPFAASIALVQRVGRRVKLVVEADTGFVAGEYDATADGFLLWYGLRFTSRNIGVDLGLVKPIYEGASDDEFMPLGFPVVNFTYRSL